MGNLSGYISTFKGYDNIKWRSGRALMIITTYSYVSINTFFCDQYLTVAIHIKHGDCVAYEKDDIALQY